MSNSLSPFDELAIKAYKWASETKASVYNGTSIRNFQKIIDDYCSSTATESINWKTASKGKNLTSIIFDLQKHGIKIDGNSITFSDPHPSPKRVQSAIVVPSTHSSHSSTTPSIGLVASSKSKPSLQATTATPSSSFPPKSSKQSNSPPKAAHLQKPINQPAPLQKPVNQSAPLQKPTKQSISITKPPNQSASLPKPTNQSVSLPADQSKNQIPSSLFTTRLFGTETPISHSKLKTKPHVASSPHAPSLLQSSSTLSDSSSQSSVSNPLKTSNPNLAPCPVCGNTFPYTQIDVHLDSCLSEKAIQESNPDLNDQQKMFMESSLNVPKLVSTDSDFARKLQQQLENDGLKHQNNPKKRARPYEYEEDEMERPEKTPKVPTIETIDLDAEDGSRWHHLSNQSDQSDDSDEESSDHTYKRSLQTFKPPTEVPSTKSLIKGGGFSEIVFKEDQTDKECPICFSEFEKGQIGIFLPCLCLYHEKCIQSWFERKPRNCPSHGDL